MLRAESICKQIEKLIEQANESFSSQLTQLQDQFQTLSLDKKKDNRLLKHYQSLSKQAKVVLSQQQKQAFANKLVNLKKLSDATHKIEALIYTQPNETQLLV